VASILGANFMSFLPSQNMQTKPKGRRRGEVEEIGARHSLNAKGGGGVNEKMAHPFLAHINQFQIPLGILAIILKKNLNKIILSLSEHIFLPNELFPASNWKPNRQWNTFGVAILRGNEAFWASSWHHNSLNFCHLRLFWPHWQFIGGDCGTEPSNAQFNEYIDYWVDLFGFDVPHFVHSIHWWISTKNNFILILF
jgi:UDP-glucose 4-epimerase